MKKKVGILTWHYYLNFGSALQAYALKKTISDSGFKAEIINYRNPKYGKPSALTDCARLLMSYAFSKKGFMLGRRVTYPFLRFHKDFLRMGKYIMDVGELQKKVSHYEAVVCGSDQIWAPSVFNSTYFLDFVNGNTKKVSYAASIGLNDIPQELQGKYTSLLSDFNAISVRESKGKELLGEKCNIEASVVLDPTLLVDVEHWHTLERKPTDICFDFSKPYLLCYFLKADNEYRESVERYAKENKLNIIGYSLNPDDNGWMLNEKDYIGPREFLWMVRNAHSVITDSYHGTIFCLLNHKKFITLERFSNDDAICQNSRIYQLVEYFGIGDNIVNVVKDTKLQIKPVDYRAFEKNLFSLRVKSKDFLKAALEEK